MLVSRVIDTLCLSGRVGGIGHELLLVRCVVALEAVANATATTTSTSTSSGSTATRSSSGISTATRSSSGTTRGVTLSCGLVACFVLVLIRMMMLS